MAGVAYYSSADNFHFVSERIAQQLLQAGRIVLVLLHPPTEGGRSSQADNTEHSFGFGSSQVDVPETQAVCLYLNILKPYPGVGFLLPPQLGVLVEKSQDFVQMLLHKP